MAAIAVKRESTRLMLSCLAFKLIKGSLILVEHLLEEHDGDRYIN